MKICVASLLIFTFLGTGLGGLNLEELKCAKTYGVTLTTLEEFCDYIVCDFEETKLPFRRFLRCMLEAEQVINQNGEIILHNDVMKKLKETIPELEDKNEYAFQLTRKRFLHRQRSVPPFCKGNLNKAWLKCARDNGIPEYNTVETLRIILGTTEPSENFKQFLLCGLVDQEILTENGGLNMDSLDTYVHRDFILKIANRTLNYKDKADFAYKITKPIVRKFIPKDLLAKADNQTEANVKI